MVATGMSLIGLDKLASRLSVYEEDMSDAVARGMVEFGGEIEAESVKLVPIDTGEQRSRSFVEGPLLDRVAGQHTVIVGYEKYDRNFKNEYAVPLHEHTYVNHKVGQAKFLEVVVNRKQSEYIPFIGRIIKENTRA
jgi:hypothetical protein